MNYYIAFPIPLNCNLQCYYCFHTEYFDYLNGKTNIDKWHNKRTFTLNQYKIWRNTHLTDATNILMEFHGGEPFCDKNLDVTYEIMDFVDIEKIELLSNGIADQSNYLKLEKYKNKIHRIGFTFHRDIIGNNTNLIKKYEENVLAVNSLGISVYVKELLITKYRADILDYKQYWTNKGIKHLIQDFKGIDRGWSHEEWKSYKPIDHMMVDIEYKKPLLTCSCRKNYKNVLIRGYDLKDTMENCSDVLACFHDPTVVGNIIENWYNPNYYITKHNGLYDVKINKKLYRGSFERDLYKSKIN